MNPSHFISVVLRKEIREIVRDGRLRLLGALVIILAFAALAFGVHQASSAQQAREAARERATTQWEGQGKKNPHVAAHYGTHVFAPATAATAIDPGVSAYLGRSVKIEAHKRNLATHSQAQDSGSGQQMGAFSVASILLQLVPLLIIALGYGIWGRERERGTLRQLLSTGVDRRWLFWGKSLALSAVVAGLLVPAALVIIAVLWSLGGGDGSVLSRLSILALGYGIYFSIFGALTLFASAYARSSRAALVLMVAVWGVFCLIMPRLATEVAAMAQPLSSQAEFARAVGISLEKGIDGKAVRETAVDAMVKDILAEQGISNAGFMVDPAASRGAELQAEARWEDMVFDHHVGQLDEAMAKQEAWVSQLGLLSPFVAMRSLSAGLCGTDYAHHRHFTDYAETWRKAFVGTLNRAFAKESGADGWSYKAGPELWKKAPPFEYAAPGAAYALQVHAQSIAHLLLWLVLAIGLALWASRRMKVV